MSEDRLLHALNASKSVKKSEKNLVKSQLSRNGDYDADKALKTAKINKNMTEIKENCDEDKILRDLDFTFDPEKDHYEPKKTVSAFNNNYTQYDRIGDKDNLSIKWLFILSDHI